MFAVLDRNMAAVRLGKNHLRWCGECNLPILERKDCPVCGSETEEVILTPPADSRPAFDQDIERIRNILDDTYGEGSGKAVLPDGHIVILNKVPGLDRMEEVVCDGIVVATMRFDLGDGWKGILRMQGAMRLKNIVSKGFVVCDDGAVKYVQDSKNLMAPGVISVHPDVASGDEVVIITKDGTIIAAGSARMSASEMVGGRGMAVKPRWYKPEDKLERKQKHTWDEVVDANTEVINKRVSEAVGFIKNTIERNQLPAIVSFSGGKDSQATLLLTLDAGLKLPILFIDTGLEFDETVQFVHDTVTRHGLELIEEKAPSDAFFGNLVHFGPPAKDYRWCCKTNKLGPTVNAINKNFPDGVLSFIGQRKYESEARNAKPRVWKNPWTPGQLGASPIQNWAAMHIWLYIFSKKEPFNVWYTRGLDRIGCFLCPASDLAEFDAIEGKSERFTQWDNFLHEYAKNNDLPPEWKKFGLWRWKNAPESMREEIERVTGRNVSDLTKRVVSKDDGPLRIKIQDGYSPCTMGYSIEAALSRPIDLKKVKPFCRALGWIIEEDPDGEYITADYVTIYRDGAIISKAGNMNDAKRRMDHAWQVIVRAEQCVGCGLCATRCRPNALFMKDGKVQINEDECIFCRDCFGPCPSANFSDDADVDFEQ